MKNGSYRAMWNIYHTWILIGIWVLVIEVGVLLYYVLGI